MLKKDEKFYGETLGKGIIISFGSDVSFVGIFYFTLGAYFSFTPSLITFLKNRKRYVLLLFVLVWFIDAYMWIIGANRDFLHHAIFKLLFKPPAEPKLIIYSILNLSINI